MRMIIAIIQPTKLGVVREGLRRLGIDGMTVCDAQGYGRQRGQAATYRGIEYRVDLLRKVAIEVVVSETSLEAAIGTIRSMALTGSEGQIGDGKIFIMPVLQSIEIASGTRGPDA
ncbi:MAG: P-II family nitrogen regulator, partial [Pirellulaceae bacterium]